MSQFSLFNNNKIVREQHMKNEGKSEFFHSSAYGAAQSSENIGAAGTGQSFETRQAIEQQRKIVQGYRNSKVIGNIYLQRRMAQMTPRTEGGAGALYGQEYGARGAADTRSTSEARRGGSASAQRADRLQTTGARGAKRQAKVPTRTTPSATRATQPVTRPKPIGVRFR